ncbi:MAG: hypothetical protein AB1768_14800 [Pseudomonadota bacterium]|jgi:hypothetical protein
MDRTELIRRVMEEVSDEALRERDQKALDAERAAHATEDTHVS